MSRFTSRVKSILSIFGGIHGPKKRMTLFIVVPAILYYLILRYYPVFQTMILSLSDAKLLKTDYQFVGLENYAFIFNDPPFFKAILNTTIYAFATTVITVILALVLAFFLNPIPYGNNFLRLLFYLPMITSGIAIATIWLWLYQARFGLFNQVLGNFGILPVPWLISKEWALPSLIIMAIWGGVGYDAIIFIAGIRGIPTEYNEAAKIDGASDWQMALHITLPLMSRVVVFIVVTSIIGSFQVFQQVFLMTRGGPLDSTRVISLSIYEYAFSRMKIGVSASMAFVLFIIVGILTVIQLKMQREDWEL
jgi:multiple sugar transport system permease protein